MTRAEALEDAMRSLALLDPLTPCSTSNCTAHAQIQAAEDQTDPVCWRCWVGMFDTGEPATVEPREQHLRFKLGATTFVDCYVVGPFGTIELDAFRGYLRAMADKSVCAMEFVKRAFRKSQAPSLKAFVRSVEHRVCEEWQANKRRGRKCKPATGHRIVHTMHDVRSLRYACGSKASMRGEVRR